MAPSCHGRTGRVDGLGTGSFVALDGLRRLASTTTRTALPYVYSGCADGPQQCHALRIGRRLALHNVVRPDGTLCRYRRATACGYPMASVRCGDRRYRIVSLAKRPLSLSLAPTMEMDRLWHGRVSHGVWRGHDTRWQRCTHIARHTISIAARRSGISGNAPRYRRLVKWYAGIAPRYSTNRLPGRHLHDRPGLAKIRIQPVTFEPLYPEIAA